MVLAREQVAAGHEMEARGGRGSLSPGMSAGEYVLEEVIAEGGGGTVYGAVHRITGAAAAVKVLHPSLTVLPKMVERFFREVQVLNMLRHPSIVEVWEVGMLPGGRPFFAMERLAGRTLGSLLDREGRLLPNEAIELFTPVCAAIAAAHSAGVIHRDIKPANVMVLEGPARRVKILDFGVAKLTGPAFSSSSGLTSEGQAIGTPTSMAPEQILGRCVDHRVDIYSLGVLLYRMLTGRPPFLAISSLAQMRQHLEERPPRPSQRAPAAAALDAIVLRAMEKEPEMRFGSVTELMAAVRVAMTGTVPPPVGASAAIEVAAAIHVEIRFDGDELSSPLADAAGRMLDSVEDALRDSGLRMGLLTGNQVLGVGLLPIDPDASAAELERLFDVAVAVRAHLDPHERAAPAVRANVCLHVGEVSLRVSGPVEITGGALTRTDLWAPREHVPALCLTAVAARRLRHLHEAERAASEGGVPIVVLPDQDLDITPPDRRAG